MSDWKYVLTDWEFIKSANLFGAEFRPVRWFPFRLIPPEGENKIIKKRTIFLIKTTQSYKFTDFVIGVRDSS